MSPFSPVVTLVFASLSASLWAQTNLLPLLPGERIHSYGGGGPQVRLGHNSCERVANEIQDAEFRKLLAKILKLPDSVLLRHRYCIGSNCGLQISSLGIADKDLESLCAVLREYVRSRSTGHSAQYAIASLRQRLIESQPEKDGFRERLFKAFPYLPRDWVKDDPFEKSALISTNSTISKTFVVIDGEVAWVYRVPLGNDGASETRVDAQEFDPQLKPKFDVAKVEAARNLERRGIRKGFGYVHYFSQEVEDILQQKYGIKRRTFRELNPGIIVD